MTELLLIAVFYGTTSAGITVALRALRPIAARVQEAQKPWACDVCMSFWTTAFVATTWTAYAGDRGYGRFSVRQGEVVRVHRYAYEFCVGTIPGALHIISSDGHAVRRMDMPDLMPTNICFDASGEKVAYVTLSASGRLVAIPWPKPGTKLAFTS